MFRESHRITLFSPPCTHPRRKSKQVYKLSSNNGIKREWDSYYRARNRYTRTPQLNIFLSKNHINHILQKPNSYLQTQRHQVRTRTLPGNSSPKRRRVHATSISQEKKDRPTACCRKFCDGVTNMASQIWATSTLAAYHWKQKMFMPIHLSKKWTVHATGLL